MISPIRLRPIDWSIVQFAVLMLCTLGGIFCAFHFGDSHEVARALLTLRERAADPALRNQAALFSVENNAPAGMQRTGSPPSRIGLPNDKRAAVGLLEQTDFTPEKTVVRTP